MHTPALSLRRISGTVVVWIALAVGAAGTAGAQRPAALAAASVARPDTACRYERCALGISPRWDGLAVVHGASDSTVATLHFFWPRDITPALEGPDSGVPGADSAAAAARHAVRVRRVGATLTDGGAVLVATSLVAALSAGQFRRGDAILAGAGAALVGISVPFQFAADGALSRAVWWHNARYAR